MFPDLTFTVRTRSFASFAHVSFSLFFSVVESLRVGSRLRKSTERNSKVNSKYLEPLPDRKVILHFHQTLLKRTVLLIPQARALRFLFFLALQGGYFTQEDKEISFENRLDLTENDMKYINFLLSCVDLNKYIAREFDIRWSGQV